MGEKALKGMVVEERYKQGLGYLSADDGAPMLCRFPQLVRRPLSAAAQTLLGKSRISP